MADHFDLNNYVALAATGRTQMFDLKVLLKAAGWTVNFCCDGTTYKADGTDNIDSAATFGNNGSYMVLEDPTGTRELLIGHLGTTDTARWYVGYSRTGIYTGGSAGVYPTAADSEDLFGTAAATAYMFRYDWNTRYHIWADSDTGSFYLLSSLDGVGTVGTLFFLDAVLEPVVGDTDPVVLGGVGGSGYDIFATGRLFDESCAADNRAARAFYDLTGTPSLEVIALSAMMSNALEAHQMFPFSGAAGVGDNTDDGGNTPTIPAIWARSSGAVGGAPFGWKGKSSFIELVGSSKAVGSTLSQDGETMNRVVYGAYRCSFPWDGSTTPVV